MKEEDDKLVQEGREVSGREYRLVGVEQLRSWSIV